MHRARCDISALSFALAQRCMWKVAFKKPAHDLARVHPPHTGNSWGLLTLSVLPLKPKRKLSFSALRRSQTHKRLICSLHHCSASHKKTTYRFTTFRGATHDDAPIKCIAPRSSTSKSSFHSRRNLILFFCQFNNIQIPSKACLRKLRNNYPPQCMSEYLVPALNG